MAKLTKNDANDMPAGFVCVKAITLPTLKIPAGGTIYVEFNGPAFDKVKIEDGVEGKITLANVTNLVTGEQCQIVMATVLLKELQEAFPDDGYSGKAFQIVKGANKKGAKGPSDGYYPYSIKLLERVTTQAS